MEESDFKYMIEALAIIKDRKGSRGTIECPKCESTLYWTRASSNKHVWGTCKETGCISWMQ